MSERAPTEQPCRLCGEPTLGQEHDRLLCRECDIERVVDEMRCLYCRRIIFNELAGLLGLVPNDHAPDCPERPGATDDGGGET